MTKADDILKKEDAKHLPGLDGVRGLAILLVMFSHFIVVGGNTEITDSTSPFLKHFYQLLTSGFLGVDLFFVLSGFLITGILVDAKARTHYFRTFYMRRALRIFPLYYSLLAIAYISEAVFFPVHSAQLSGADSPWWYWLYASNIGIACKGTWLASPTWIDLGHFWSLAVEEQFYMVWPLVVFLVPARWLGWLSLALVITSPTVGNLVRHHVTDTISTHADVGTAKKAGDLAAYTSTLARVGLLAGGAWLSLMWRRPKAKEWIQKLALPVVIVSGIYLLYACIYRDKISTAEPAIVCFTACVAVAAGAGGQSLLLKFFSGAFLRWMGKYSYGIYVYHHALHAVWIRFIWETIVKPLVGGGWAGTILYTLIATAASLGLAYLSWHLFEARILALKRYFSYEKEGIRANAKAG